MFLRYLQRYYLHDGTAADDTLLVFVLIQKGYAGRDFMMDNVNGVGDDMLALAARNTKKN